MKLSIEKLLFGLIYSLLVLAGAVFVISPGAMGWTRSFIAWAPEFSSPVYPGDHLQMTYYLWLWSDSIRTLSHLPWQDVYQFAATGVDSNQPFGWPLVLIFIPIEMVLGPVAGYNSLVLLAFVLSAWAMYGLARELRCSRAAAVVAGFAFAFAPVRIMQATAHVNALLAPLLPLMLMFIERMLRSQGKRRSLAAWGAVASYLSIIASGEGHLAVYATLLLPGYLVIRFEMLRDLDVRQLRPQIAALVGGVLAIGSLTYFFVLRPSVAGEGRAVDEAAHHAPRLENLLPWTEISLERYAYLGAPILLLSAVAIGMAFKRRNEHRLLILGLGAGALLALMLAVATGLSDYPRIQQIARSIPFFSFIRVPGRILIVTALCLAILTGFGVDALIRGRPKIIVIAPLMMLWMVVDLPNGLFGKNGSDIGYIRAVPSGAALFELPAYGPADAGASVYGYGVTERRGPLVSGYSPFATPAIHSRVEGSLALDATPLDECRWKQATRSLGIEYVVVHLDLYGDHPLQRDLDGAALAQELDRSEAFELKFSDGIKRVYKINSDLLDCA